MQNRLLVSLFFFGSCLLAHSQKIENLTSSFDGKKVAILYDLIFNDTTRRFKVELYASTDNFLSPLTNTKGATGAAIKPGLALKIHWDVRKALPPDFDQEISYKIKATLVPLPPKPVVKPPEEKALVTKPDPVLKLVAPTTCRRGKILDVSCLGTKPADVLMLELYDDENKKQTIATPKGGSTTASWEIPTNFKTGKYTLKLTANGKATEAVSTPLTIKHRTPFIVKALPLALIGGIILALPKAQSNVLPGPVSPN
jgi:hypothetical protein